MAKSRQAVIRQRYNRIKDATGNVDLARKYRYYSPIRIKREIGIDITKKPKDQTIDSREEWGRMASRKDPLDYPDHVIAYAVQRNREVGADDFDRYGFIYAYKRVIEGLGPKTIDRQVIYDRNAGTFIYLGIRGA